MQISKSIIPRVNIYELAVFKTQYAYKSCRSGTIDPFFNEDINDGAKRDAGLKRTVPVSIRDAENPLQTLFFPYFREVWRSTLLQDFPFPVTDMNKVCSTPESERVAWRHDGEQ